MLRRRGCGYERRRRFEMVYLIFWLCYTPCPVGTLSHVGTLVAAIPDHERLNDVHLYPQRPLPTFCPMGTSSTPSITDPTPQETRSDH